MGECTPACWRVSLALKGNPDLSVAWGGRLNGVTFRHMKDGKEGQVHFVVHRIPGQVFSDVPSSKPLLAHTQGDTDGIAVPITPAT